MHMYVCIYVYVFCMYMCRCAHVYVCACVYVCGPVYVYSCVALGIEPEALTVLSQCSIIKLYPSFLSLFLSVFILFVKKKSVLVLHFPPQDWGLSLVP